MMSIRRMMVTILAALLLAGIADIAVAKDSEEQSWPTEADVRVQIEILSGRIEIEGWDRNEVVVRVGGDSAAAVDVKASRRRIRIRGPKFRGDRSIRNMEDFEVDVHVSVPAHSRIEVKTTNGRISAEGVAGTVEFITANGNIEVRGKPTEAKLETINGSIKLEGRGTLVDARTVSGSIDLSGVGSELFASAISGSIRAEAESLERIDMKTLSGSIELTTRLDDGARVNLKSFSGAIELEVPGDTSSRFEIRSFSGGIRNELPITDTTSAGGQGRHLRFTSGEGEGRVTIESFSGSVEIRKRE